MKVAFYPGCVSRGGCPELYPSAVKVAAQLGLELEELTDVGCNGAGVLSREVESLAKPRAVVEWARRNPNVLKCSYKPVDRLEGERVNACTRLVSLHRTDTLPSAEAERLCSADAVFRRSAIMRLHFLLRETAHGQQWSVPSVHRRQLAHGHHCHRTELGIRLCEESSADTQAHLPRCLLLAAPNLHVLVSVSCHDHCSSYCHRSAFTLDLLVLLA